MAGGIERDDAGGDARQHRLHEGAARVELGVGRTKRAGLLIEPAGHPVERRGQRLHLVFGLGDRHPRREIAFLDTARGFDELAYGPDKAVGEPESGQDRQADNDQSAQKQRGVETKLTDPSAPQKRPIVIQHSTRPLHLIAELGVENVGGINVGIRPVIDFCEGADPVGGIRPGRRPGSSIPQSSLAEWRVRAADRRGLRAQMTESACPPRR